MPRLFPIFMDISGRKVIVYGAGKIASRRILALLPFAPSLTVCAPEVSGRVLEAERQGFLTLKREAYQTGSIPEDTFLVLAATDDAAVNEAVCRECHEKKILVNVCSDRTLCDFQFPGLAVRGDLVVGVNAGGMDHRRAREWTERIRKEVERDGDDDQAEASENDSKSEENGEGNPNGQKFSGLPHVCEGGHECEGGDPDHAGTVPLECGSDAGDLK